MMGRRPGFLDECLRAAERERELVDLYGLALSLASVEEGPLADRLQNLYAAHEEHAADLAQLLWRRKRPLRAASPGLGLGAATQKELLARAQDLELAGLDAYTRLSRSLLPEDVADLCRRLRVESRRHLMALLQIVGPAQAPPEVPVERRARRPSVGYESE